MTNRNDRLRSVDRFGQPGCRRGTSVYRLAKVDLHGEWRILVVTNMADDETGAPGG